jgi:hypothetical protein
MKNRISMVAKCILLCLMAGSSAGVMARGGGFHDGGYHGGGFHDGGYRGGYGWSSGFHHSYCWGGFYIGPEWFWGPTIVVGGIPYYYYGGTYYTAYDNALVAVAPPVETVAQASAAPQAAAPAASQVTSVQGPTRLSGDTVTVNVPGEKGAFTAVKLVKANKGYIGPQGEYYPDHPTVEELKVLYGN